MDDREITRLCAQAMGWHVGKLASKVVAYKVNACAIIAGNAQGGESVYDPLHDDAQCMALVKRFGIGFDPTRGEDFASAAIRDEHGTMLIYCDPSLNRAICLCVANMQSKEST